MRTGAAAVSTPSSSQRIRLSIRIGRPLAGKFDKSLDSSCPGGGREFGDPIDWEVGFCLSGCFSKAQYIVLNLWQIRPTAYLLI